MLFKKINLLIIIAIGTITVSFAQTMKITGTVYDSATNIPLPNVSVYFKNSRGTRTDTLGNYILYVNKSSASPMLQFSLVGYKVAQRKIDMNEAEQTVSVLIEQQSGVLEDVVVKQKKEKYRNKENPAVELIRNVIAHKSENRMNAYDYAMYEKYERLVGSVSNVATKIRDKKFFQKYNFFLKNIDTTKFPGKGLLPVYMQERVSENYYQRSPQKTKQIYTGDHTVDFGEFIDTKGITSYLQRLYEEVDIYENNISLFTNEFLSPIAGSAPTFYMYYIRDTLMIDSTPVVQLYFTPRNPQDALFRGFLWITLDGNYAIQRVSMFAPPVVNINFIRELRINLDFEKRDDGKYLMVKSDVLGDFGLGKKGAGFFGERLVVYKNFITNTPIPPGVFKGPAEVMQDSAESQNDDFWVTKRFEPLTSAESKTYENVDSLKNMKSFRNLMDWLTFFLAGYKQTFHNKFEVGPASTFYSYNPVEGFRLRFGGRTTPSLSKRYFFETYGAYGFRDQKWKYFGSATYSLNNKSIYSFPQNYIRASYQRETKIPGQELQFVQEDNLFLSAKRGNNDKWLYNDYFKLTYQHEFESHFSYNLEYKHWKQSPAGSLTYEMPLSGGGVDVLKNITTSDVALTLRYAPKESYYVGKVYRVPIVNRHPIFTFNYNMGLKDFLGGQYNYQRINFNFFKRNYLSQFGFTDVSLSGGYISGKLPWPLLFQPPANQTFAYQLQSFNLMNFMEFSYDRYASLMIDHYFDGFFFNKIPLFKKLQWREIIDAKIMFGGLRDENDPFKNSAQMLFPTTKGAASTFSLDPKKPYIEAGFGISNIFKLLRVEFIRRFTYLDNPDIAKFGIRTRVKFDF
jgi:hypothetical protein